MSKTPCFQKYVVFGTFPGLYYLMIWYEQQYIKMIMKQ